MKTFTILLFIDLFTSTNKNNAQSLETLLSEKPPLTPSVFAKGIISDGLNNRDFTLSPDGNQIFYTIQSARFLKSTIISIQKVKGKWQNPQIAPFSGVYRDLEAFFSPDGKTVYFSSDRPSTSNDSTNDFDIWKVTKTSTGWSLPVNLGANVNSPKNEFYPSVAANQTIYFTAEPDRGYGEEDIVRCRFENGSYTTREILDSAINTKGDEFNAFIDPQEQFIIFSCYKSRSDEQGGGDLYISYNTNGQWKPAINMSAVNTPFLDYCPFVTKDRKTLFFSSNRNQLKTATAKRFKDLTTLLSSAGNYTDDIYRIDFSGFIK